MTDSAPAVVDSGSRLPFAPTLLDRATAADSALQTERTTRRKALHRSPRPDRDALYAEFQPLVRRLIRQYGEDVESRGDLQGEIYYRFCLLLDAYDPERGVPLRPYLVRQLTASVYTYARQGWRRQRREVTLDTSFDCSGPAGTEDPSRD